MKGLLAKDTTLMSIIILAIILIYASFSWLCPIMIDDYMFWDKYLTANNGSILPSLSGYCNYVRDLWLYMKTAGLPTCCVRPSYYGCPNWLGPSSCRDNLCHISVSSKVWSTAAAPSARFFSCRYGYAAYCSSPGMTTAHSCLSTMLSTIFRPPC